MSEQFLNNVGSLTLPELKCSLPILSTTDTKSMDRESKLYHSDYYIVKMVYDTFYKEIGLEKFKVTIPVTNYSFPLEFKQTNTINSKFIFHANFDYISGVAYQSEIDYDSYLVVGRNNEETVFSSDYINYIRTGYNYDQKAQTLEMQQATSNMVINGLAGIASTAATIAGGNVITGAAAISHATQFISGLTSMAYSQKNFDNSMSAKLSQLANQSTGVSGADDIDLLSYYNGNRLEIKKYKPRDLMQQALYNLFFYTGYIHNVQAIPSLNSRYWFNFIQCAPHFKNEQTSVYIDYLDDIKARFNSGVTIFHHHTTWDFEQKYENWENSLLNAGGGGTPTYTLTLLYVKDGTEDISLMDVRSIDKGTEVFPSDYKLDLAGYTFQDSVPNDSFTMNKNNFIQYNYITTPSRKGTEDNPLTENDLNNNYIYWKYDESFCVKNVTSENVIYNLIDGDGSFPEDSDVYVKPGFDFKLKFLTRMGAFTHNCIKANHTSVATTSPAIPSDRGDEDLNKNQLYSYTIHGLSKGEAFNFRSNVHGMEFGNITIYIV